MDSRCNADQTQDRVRQSGSATSEKIGFGRRARGVLRDQAKISNVRGRQVEGWCRIEVASQGSVPAEFKQSQEQDQVSNG